MNIPHPPNMSVNWYELSSKDGWTMVIGMGECPYIMGNNGEEMRLSPATRGPWSVSIFHLDMRHPWQTLARRITAGPAHPFTFSASTVL
jgi:hypothetical protein